METIIKTNRVTKDVIDSIKEATKSSDKKGVTSKGINFLKVLNKLILF